jgi:cell division protein FtsA
MPNNKYLEENYIFGLDIGTRSVVGIVGYKTAGGFNVVAHYIVKHETRAMIDGQIHDVDKVAQTIKKVKTELENRLSMPLKEVCIAAAGRVLKTKSIHVEQSIEKSMVIDEHLVYALELVGIEKAHQEVNSTLSSSDLGFHCVGYTVTKYYLNDYQIGKLEGHKGKKIGADVLATFLPNEVVDSLHKVVNDSDLEVKNLTLEPIAAIDVAVPYNYRLLNIALVDIGAGTSDIAITKEGSIIAFGMIPIAGDEITEAIVHKYLVDFNSAENMKIKSSGKSKKISYVDIMEIKNTVDREDVLETIFYAVDRLASSIAEKIIELNGSNPTNAVFIVGGGGQVNGFTDALAKYLNINKDRVALRGKSVLMNINFETAIKKSPELVTPIGICFSGMDNTKHDFIQVYLNDEPVRVFNTKKVTIMDVVAFKGYNPSNLIAKKGMDLTFYINEMERVIKGAPAEPAQILINNEVASLSSHIEMNDYITIIPAKKGKNASLTTYEIINELEDINVFMNNEQFRVKPNIFVDDICINGHVNISDGARIKILPKTLKTFFEEHKIVYNDKEILVNNSEADLFRILNNDDLITIKESGKIEFEKDIDVKINNSHQNDLSLEKNDSSQGRDTHTISVVVNGNTVILSGKDKYIFVDIFDYIEFDLSKPQGNVVCELNHNKTSYMAPIHNNDIIKVYWDNINIQEGK